MTDQEKSLQLRMQALRHKFARQVQVSIEDFNRESGLRVVDIEVHYSMPNDQAEPYPVLTVRFK